MQYHMQYRIATECKYQISVIISQFAIPITIFTHKIAPMLIFETRVFRMVFIRFLLCLFLECAYSWGVLVYGKI